MTMQVVNVRPVNEAGGLSDLQREQLKHVGGHFDGQDRTAEQRFIDLPITPEAEADGIDWDDGNFTGQLLSVSEVHEDGMHKWDLWVHHADNGCLFVRGTTTCIAGRVQSNWMTPDAMKPHELGQALDAAMREAKIY